MIFHSCVSLPAGKYGNLCQWRYQCLPHWTKMLREVMSRSCGVGVTCGNILKTKTFAWKPPEHTHIIYIYIYLHTSMTVYIQYPVFTSNEHVMKGLIKLCKEKPYMGDVLIIIHFLLIFSCIKHMVSQPFNYSIDNLVFHQLLFNHLAHLLGCLFFWHDGPVWYSYIIIYLLVGVHWGTPL